MTSLYASSLLPWLTVVLHREDEANDREANSGVVFTLRRSVFREEEAIGEAVERAEVTARRPNELVSALKNILYRAIRIEQHQDRRIRHF